jgi:hypothetical protein
MFMTEVYAITECRTIINTTGAIGGAGIVYPSGALYITIFRYRLINTIELSNIRVCLYNKQFMIADECYFRNTLCALFYEWP